MNDRPNPPQSSPPEPPPSGFDFRTSAQILRQTSFIFRAHLLMFALLASVILAFRYNVEKGTHSLIGFIDRDASLKTLLSRLDPPAAADLHASDSAAAHRQPRRRHRRPFLHLTRVGTLDDDFFSGDDDYDRSLFGSYSKSSPNGSFVILGNFGPRLGFSNYVADNGIGVSEIVSSSLSFKLPAASLQPAESMEGNGDKDEVNSLEDSPKKGAEEGERIVDLRFLIKGLELRQRDASALFFLICLLSAAYGYVILGFIVTYSWVLGIVFVVVAHHFLVRHRPWMGTLWDGSNFGLRRISGLILMKWAVRDALTQLLGLWFFSEIEDQYSFFKIFLRLKLMPFSIMSTWIRGFEKETAGFLFAWLFSDMIVEFIFALDYWVAIMDARMNGRQIMREGCYLLSTMFRQAVLIRCLESVLCGSFTRWTLARIVGKLLATAFQSVMEVYFMVAWLVFYLAVRTQDATSLGRTFGLRELESVVQGNNR